MVVAHGLIDRESEHERREMRLVYLAGCTAPPLLVDRSDVIKDFTSKVLKWWADAEKSKFLTWAIAARIVFAFNPNSAAAEGVFSLVKLMFGYAQDSAISDYRTFKLPSCSSTKSARWADNGTVGSAAWLAQPRLIAGLY